MIAVYSCSTHTTITRCEIPEAVLPIMVTCVHCSETMVRQDAGEGKPTHEWYIPEKKGRGITKEVKRQFKILGIYLREIKTEENLK